MTVLPYLYMRDDTTTTTTDTQNNEKQSAYIQWGRFLIAPAIIIFIAIVIFAINWSRARNGMRPMKGTAWLSPTVFCRYDINDGVQPIQQVPKTNYPTVVYSDPPVDVTPPAYTEATNPIDMGVGYYSEGGQFVQTAPNLYEARDVPVEKPKSAAAGLYNQRSSSVERSGKY